MADLKYVKIRGVPLIDSSGNVDGVDISQFKSDFDSHHKLSTLSIDDHKDFGGKNISGVGSLTVNTINLGADVNLYRSSANWLKTDDSLYVKGNIEYEGSLTARNIKPSTTNTYSLGDSTYKWKDINIAGNINVDGNLNIGGTVDGVDVSTHVHDGTARGGVKISYNNLNDKPFIPLALGELTQSTNYRTVTDAQIAEFHANHVNRIYLDSIDQSLSSGASPQFASLTTTSKSVDGVNIPALKTAFSSHTHTGGADGQAIAYSSLTGRPTLGTAAQYNVGTSANNIPQIGADGTLPASIIPAAALSDVFVVDTIAEMLTLAATKGDWCMVTSETKTYVLGGEDPSVLANWKEILVPSGYISSVNGKSGSSITLDASDIGLGNVTNESKATMFTSPAFTGIPTAPTAAKTVNSTQIATTAFVKSVVGDYAPLASPALTGTPTAPTAAKTVNNTQLATTAYVKSVVADYAPLASPALTGTPTAPTAAKTVNNTQLATTAYVKSVVADYAPLTSPSFIGNISVTGTVDGIDLSAKAVEWDAKLPLTGGTLSGPLTVLGTAASNSLKVRGLRGCTADGASDDALYLNYNNTKPVYINGENIVWHAGNFNPNSKAESSHTHAATDITQTASYRFVTDVEKATWNAKSNFSGNISDLSINANKNWNNYNLTNVGNLTSASFTSTGSSIFGTALPHWVTDATQNNPIPIQWMDNLGRSAMLKTINVATGMGNYFYLVDKNPDYTVTHTIAGSTSAMFDNNMATATSIPLSSLPYVLTITKNSGSIAVTDVVNLYIFGHRLWNYASAGTLTDWQVEVLDSEGIWHIVLKRVGVSDALTFSIPLHVAPSASYRSIYGVRITINGATESSFAPGRINIAAIQLRDFRPAHTPADAVGALDQAGGRIYGDVDLRANLKIMGNTVINQDGLVDGVDISAHTHDGTAINGPKISASNLIQDASNRLVTDAEKSSWNAKWNYNENTIKSVKVDKAKDADTVSGFTVAKSVPSDAKFTDTTYSEITTAEIDAGTASTLRTMTGRRAKYILDKAQSFVDTHEAKTSNPHGVTKAQVGLGNVDNIKQATKAEFNAHDADDIRHITASERTAWNAKQDALSGDVTGHYHSSDRNRSNHTGTQPASTITGLATVATSGEIGDIIINANKNWNGKSISNLQSIDIMNKFSIEYNSTENSLDFIYI